MKSLLLTTLCVCIACNKTITNGHYVGDVESSQTSVDGPKIWSGRGDVTITSSKPNEIDLTVNVVVEPSLTCTLHGTLSQASYVIAPTACVTKEDSHMKGGPPHQDATAVTVSGSLSRTSAREVALTLDVVGPKWVMRESMKAVLEP